MGNLKQDDFSGKTYNPEDEQTYTIQVKKQVDVVRQDGTAGKKTLMLELEVTHDSFMSLIGKPFEGKKILSRWSEWVNPSAETLAKYPNARGKWVILKK